MRRIAHTPRTCQPEAPPAAAPGNGSHRQSARSSLDDDPLPAAGAGGGVLAGGLRAGPAVRGRPGQWAVEFGLDGAPALFAVLAPEGGAVFQDGVNLPAFAPGGSGDPELVLPGVAAGGIALVDGGQASLGEPGLVGVDRVGAVDFYA